MRIGGISDMRCIWVPDRAYKSAKDTGGVQEKFEGNVMSKEVAAASAKLEAVEDGEFEF